MKVSEEKQQVQLTVFTTQPSNVASRHQLSAERERRDAKTRVSRYSQSATMGGELSAVDRGKVIIIIIILKYTITYSISFHGSLYHEQPV